MRLDDLHLWYLAEPASSRYIGVLKLVSAGKGVSLSYAPEWLAHGFALSEDWKRKSSALAAVWEAPSPRL